MYFISLITLLIGHQNQQTCTRHLKEYPCGTRLSIFKKVLVGPYFLLYKKVVSLAKNLQIDKNIQTELFLK